MNDTNETINVESKSDEKVKGFTRVAHAIFGIFLFVGGLFLAAGALVGFYNTYSVVQKLSAAGQYFQSGEIGFNGAIKTFIIVMSLWISKRSIRLVQGKKWAINTPKGEKFWLPWYYAILIPIVVSFCFTMIISSMFAHV